MNQRAFIIGLVGTSLCSIAACANSDFIGASGTKGPLPAQSSNALPDATPPTAQNLDKPTIGFGEGGKACIRSGAPRNINLSIAVHQDSKAAATDRYNGGIPATADLTQSSVATFNIDEIAGNLLPVSNFKLDDMAIIVPANVTLNSVLSCGGGDCTRSRIITVPSVSMLVYNAADPKFASGSLDSHASTTYIFGPKKVVLPGNQNRKRSEVAALGIPGIAHNKITLKELKNRGFTDDQGNVAFKVLLVPHGSGFVEFMIKLAPCK
ncbi:MAG: hypothetical protein RIQ81_1038 [Pseudomonadota bacterium]|jgi:hypothetical protein